MVDTKEINIGLIIEQKLNELNISKSELARRIGIPNQNVNRILEKSSIDTDKLIKISKALDYNFFQEFISTDNDTDKTDGKIQNNVAAGSIEEQPLCESDKKFYQEQIQFLTGQVKDLSQRIHELEDELRNIHREKKASVG